MYDSRRRLPELEFYQSRAFEQRAHVLLGEPFQMGDDMIELLQHRRDPLVLRILEDVGDEQGPAGLDVAHEESCHLSQVLEVVV